MKSTQIFPLLFSALAATSALHAHAEGSGENSEVSNRVKTLEGSDSPFSFQANLSYSGSSIQHPFSAEAPNPTNAPQAIPVQLVGTLSGRYRVNKDTTIGLGTGFQVVKPFQDPQDPSVSDPNADIAYSFSIAGIHNHLDFFASLYTDHLFYNAGYRTGYSLSNDASYRIGRFSLGVLLGVDWNSFGGAKDQSAQILYDIVTDPYFEYQLSPRFNLRSVLGIVSNHIRNDGGFFTYQHPRIYQTIGLGIQAMEALYLYTFVEFTPFSHFTASNSIVGFSAIINLF